jgi:hypothetical protein
VASAQKPTAVELAAISAESERGVVVVTWALARTEPSLVGFHVYRSIQKDDGFERLTSDLLTGKDGFEFRDIAVKVKQVYYYLIEAVDLDGETTRFEPIRVRVGAPTAFALRQNTPNPFNPATTIRFDLPKPVKVTLVVYNLLGQEVIRLLDNQFMEAGFHRIQWTGRNGAGRTTASGMYLYRIQAGTFTVTKKMTLLR